MCGDWVGSEQTRLQRELEQHSDPAANHGDGDERVALEVQGDGLGGWMRTGWGGEGGGRCVWTAGAIRSHQEDETNETRWLAHQEREAPTSVSE